MRAYRLRPIKRIPTAVRRRAVILAWLASVSCTWTITNAAQAPGVASSAAAPARTDEFSGLLERARRETGELRAISGMSIPELGEVGSTAELDAALINLVAATGQEIARYQREHAEFLLESESAGTESARLDALATRLTNEIEHDRTAIAEAEKEAAAEIRAASRARSETAAWQKSINQIRREITQVRNQLFPRLRHAAQRGWILPPSSYRPLPAPLSPVKQDIGYTRRELSPVGSPIPQRVRPNAMNLTAVPIRAAPSLETRLHADVQARLDQLPALLERARTAAALRDEAIRSLAQRRSETDVQSARLSALQPQRDAAASRLGTARKNLERARQASIDHNAQRASFRTAAVHAWIEWGIFQWLEKRSAQLVTGGESRSTDPDFLEDWRAVAATSVQLGSDPLEVIARFPAEMAARGEEFEEIRQDLARVREKFGIGFVLTRSELGPGVQPYLMREGP
jgi:hypothetical protein